MAVHHVIFPAALVALIFVHPLAVAISKTVDELASEDAVCIDPFLSPTAMLHIIAPFTLINSSHGIRISPLTMGHRHFKVANVLIAQAVNENAISTDVALSLIHI